MTLPYAYRADHSGSMVSTRLPIACRVCFMFIGDCVVAVDPFIPGYMNTFLRGTQHLCAVSVWAVLCALRCSFAGFACWSRSFFQGRRDSWLSRPVTHNLGWAFASGFMLTARCARGLREHIWLSRLDPEFLQGISG